MPVGHVDDAQEGEESDTALGHLEEEAPEAEEEAPEAAELAPGGGPWMRVSTCLLYTSPSPRDRG